MKPLEIILSILLVLVLSKTAKADYWPDIYAVAEIEMKNGEIIEGFVQIAPISEGFYHPNGFAYAWKEGMTPVPSFFSLYYAGEFKNTYSRFYYLENETPDRNSSSEVQLDSSGRDLLLTSKLVHQSKYRLTDTLKIVVDLNFYQRPDTMRTVSICVNDIFRFKLLNSPSAKWTDLIAAKRKEYQDAFEANPSDYSGDFFEPYWYHELSRDRKIEFDRHFRN